MTPVQAATLPVILSGRDLLAKAKTGTGKTLAFLIPTLHTLLTTPRRAEENGPDGPIRALVISPTRELSAQTEQEARTLLSFVPDGRLRTALIVGGGRKASSDLSHMRGPLDLLVATPGRLKDHCENTAGFSARLRGVTTLVLDEGDQLLAAGFLPDIKRILAHVSSSRQSLCFSATVPPELAAVLGSALRADHASIDCVGKDAPDTHARVPQSYAIVPHGDTLAAVTRLVREELAEDPLAKVIVFYTTARQTQFGAEALNALGVSALEIHSRKSQGKRDAAAAAFRAASSAVLCSSDVSARGVDYPDVTLVVQIGVPSSREQYIHRLGRTGRAGKEGRGVILLAPYERFFLAQLDGLPLVAEAASGAACRAPTPSEAAAVDAAVARVPFETRASAYSAWLGFYNSLSSKMKWSKEQLVAHANQYGASAMGLATPPPMQASIVGKMGLRGVPGLNVVKGESGYRGPPAGGRAAAGPASVPWGAGAGGAGRGDGRGEGGRKGGGGGGRRSAPAY
jgi:ATP-dependent RNA helicase MSS116